MKFFKSKRQKKLEGILRTVKIYTETAIYADDIKRLQILQIIKDKIKEVL